MFGIIAKICFPLLIVSIFVEILGVFLSNRAKKSTDKGKRNIKAHRTDG